MSDPRKPLNMMTDGESEKFEMALTLASAICCEHLEISRISFTTSALGVFAMSLAAIDQKAANKLLGALTDAIDPNADARRQDAAEQRRREAVRALCDAYDLRMAETSGSA